MIILTIIIPLTLLARCIVAFPYNLASNPFNDQTPNTTTTPSTLIQQNSTTLESGHPIYPVTCLVRPNETKVPPSVRKALVADCRSILYDGLAQVRYVSDDVEFANREYKTPSGKVYPAVWTRGLCTIYVRSQFTDDTTWMSLLDVVMAADRILTNCVEGGSQLAGSSSVGSMVKTFHVVLIARVANAGNNVASSGSLLDLEESKRSLDSASDESGMH